MMLAHSSAVVLVLIADTTCMCDSAKQYIALQAIVVFLHIMVKAANLYSAMACLHCPGTS